MLVALRLQKIAKWLHSASRVIWENAEQVGKAVATVLGVVGLTVAGITLLIAKTIAQGSEPISEPALGN